MSDSPPPYSEHSSDNLNKQGRGPNYGAVPAGAYQGPAGSYGPGAPQSGYPQGYPPAGAYTGPQNPGYPGVPPPQGGYDQPKYPQGSNYQHQGYNISVQPQTAVVMVGGCPACRVGVLEDDFTCLGVFCAILFFPIGILCCLAMRQRRCVSCGAVFG